MKYAFVSFLGTENFLPGILALKSSLETNNSDIPFLVLITSVIKKDTIEILHILNCQVQLIEEIKNPFPIANDHRGFNHMYTKLRVFGLIEYDKIVYIDSDMLVLQNISKLFKYPHFSATSAGSILPENSSWKNLNAGLIVIEPSENLILEILQKIEILNSEDGSDQGFLHSYHPDWPDKKHLHLPHRYNVPFNYLEEYCDLTTFNFSYKRRKLNTDIAIIHYWGPVKPWHYDIKKNFRKDNSLLTQALILWHDYFKSAINYINKNDKNFIYK